MNITNPYVPTTSNEEIGKLLRGINDLRKEIAVTKASIQRDQARIGYAPVLTENYFGKLDRLHALELDLAGSEWKVEDILLKRLADYGVYTAADLQLFRRS